MSTTDCALGFALQNSLTVPSWGGNLLGSSKCCSKCWRASSEEKLGSFCDEKSSSCGTSRLFGLWLYTRSNVNTCTCPWVVQTLLQDGHGCGCLHRDPTLSPCLAGGSFRKKKNTTTSQFLAAGNHQGVSKVWWLMALSWLPDLQQHQDGHVSLGNKYHLRSSITSLGLSTRPPALKPSGTEPLHAEDTEWLGLKGHLEMT